MSSIARLQDALLQLEDHLCRAGSALVRAEQDSEAADVTRMLQAKLKLRLSPYGRTPAVASART